MTRKHFVALAAELESSRPENSETEIDKVTIGMLDARLYQWKRDVQAIARACEACNPRFDKETFFHRCGYYS